MAEELLNGADVVAALQQVGGEGVAEGVAGHPFVETGFAGFLFRALMNTLVKGDGGALVGPALSNAKLAENRCVPPVLGAW